MLQTGMDFIVALNRPALLEARQRAYGVLREGIAFSFYQRNYRTLFFLKALTLRCHT